jgi:serine protease Do
VRVEAVDGVAARAGLREGDLILSIDNVEVTGAKQFEAAVAKLDRSRPISVLARRGEWVNYFILRPSR